MSFLKIFFGVFLGVLAAYAIIIFVRAVKEGTIEQRNLQRDREVNRVSPDDLIRKCGPPTSDKLKDADFRTLSYPVLTFDYIRLPTQPPTWMNLSVASSAGLHVQTDLALYEMPCLEKP